MNSSTNRPRRKRGKPSSSDNNDGDIYVPSSSRSNYNMNRDGPSAHVDSQERFYKHSSDAHHRSSRDEYDATDSKDADQWNAHKGGREWSPREFEHSHTSLRRGDGQGWGTSTFNDDRPHPDHESPDWRRGDQDDERGGKWDNKESRGRGSRRWQSDKGWDTRKRDRNQNRRPLDNPDESATPKEDRFWEPGPGWQSRGADQGHRNQRPRSNVQGKNKGKKQVQNRQRQRGDKDRDRGRFPDRDRRQNEDTLNNWQRREIHPLPPKPRSPVKRALTPSRSRSRTPDSFYSRRSSRSRSRSRSYSPRPNAYHSSPPRARSPSPPGRRWGANRSRSPASSQRSHSQRGRPRRRSISSFSSYSGSRSRSSSRSADDRPKAKHRLPPATSIKDISLSISKTSLQQRSEFLNSREPDSNRNGKVYTNGKQRNHRPLPSEAERRANLEMPPPSDAHSITTSRVQQSDSSTSPVSQRHELLGKNVFPPRRRGIGGPQISPGCRFPATA
ncbi:hypothetical protein SCLCIDRAFT_1080854 [Scleroderma citrinum Foug A]|uniref:Uncharacterized protein n=1 Tax=Scleroderma citrinum Foug A TaxID=1036808 RepID=A0A0C3EI47_9AGAM|nr:hypothetical protein SCLCIDRAFT_1080854 [Scleroderma citrinum Foug A]